MRIMAFDPGQSTGWVYYDADTEQLIGGTALMANTHREVWDLMNTFSPDQIVCETYALYPGKAAAQSWSTFYPVEVIGVIKLWCLIYERNLEMQGASIKKYSGHVDTRYDHIQKEPYNKTHHTADAFMHLKYYLRMRRVWK